MGLNPDTEFQEYLSRLEREVHSTVNNLLTISPPITISGAIKNPKYIKSLKLIIISRLLIIINKEELGDQGNFSTLLTIQSSDYCIGIVKHFLEYGAATRLELGRRLGASTPIILKILQKLESLGLIERSTVVYPETPHKPGPKPTVWALRGAAPKCSADCIKRHYELSGVKNAEDRALINDILQQVTAHFFSKERFGRFSTPKVGEILQSLKLIQRADELNPSTRKKIALRVYDKLSTMESAGG